MRNAEPKTASFNLCCCCPKPFNCPQKLSSRRVSVGQQACQNMIIKLQTVVVLKVGSFLSEFQLVPVVDMVGFCL